MSKNLDGEQLQKAVSEAREIENALQAERAKYLANLSRSLHIEQSNAYIKKTQSMVESAIRKGKVELGARSRDTSTLLRRVQLTDEERRLLEQRAKREEINLKMRYLTDQLKPKSNSELSVSVKSTHDSTAQILSKEEHEASVRKVREEKLLRKQRNSELIALLEKQRREEDKRKIEMEELEKQTSLEKKRRQLEKSIQKRQQEHEEFMQQERSLQKQFEEVKRKKLVHEQLEAKYMSNVVMPQEEEKKRMLKEIKEFKERYNMEAALNHQKEYLSARKLRESRQLQQQETQWKYRPPERTQRLTKLLAEEAEVQARKLHEKRDKIQEKIRRQQEYLVVVKSERMPQISPSKQKEIQQRLEAELSKKIKPERDPRQIGLNYLKYSKEMRRAESMGDQTPSTVPYDSRSCSSHLKKVIPFERRSVEEFEELRRKRLQKIQGSQTNKNDKLLRLEAETRKIQEKIKQKEESIKFGVGKQAVVQSEKAQLVLSSIRAKMGIINVLKT